MARLKLLDFQEAAAGKLTSGALDYFTQGPDRMGGRPVPFVGQLKAVTGAGKTPIICQVMGRIGSAIVLWTTKFGSVVDQTFENLSPGGKYHHLLGGNADVIKFSEIPSAAEWDRVLSREKGVTILLSTVAAWNSAVKDDRLNVHKVVADWGDKSRWDQLKEDRTRPLWVVYDEAHNSTPDQVELLDDLAPSGFFVASASPVGGKLQQYLTMLPEDKRDARIVPVSTRAVVDNELLKSTISLADYQSSDEEMLIDAASKRASLESALSAAGSPIVPKAIYVVESSNAGESSGEARPTAIWRTLTSKCGVRPSEIAVCTNTKELPQDAVRVSKISQLAGTFTHIIFNKKLQEGWDDPAVYVCYFDGRTESPVRIQQVLGRALRQPGAKHFPDEDLNTAYFYIRCRNETLERITDKLKEELRIYKDDGEGDEFEPFRIKEERRSPPKIPVKPHWEGKLAVPRLMPEVPSSDPLRKLIAGKTYGFDEEERSTPGKALVNVVSVKTGEVQQQQRDLLEEMRLPCGVYLQEQIRILSKNCVSAIKPSTFSNDKLDKLACLRSKALDHYREVAVEVVREYENKVRLESMGDISDGYCSIGSYQPTGDIYRYFDNAAHAHYDSKSFNDDETALAKELDRYAEYVWVRNRDKVGYGIPLPVKCGTSSNFFPDFLWWVGKTIWAIDPTGKFILEEKVRTKLLNIAEPRIALVTPGKLDRGFQKTDEAGFTLLRHRVGNVHPETFDTLAELVAQLVEDSDQSSTLLKPAPAASSRSRKAKATPAGVASAKKGVKASKKASRKKSKQ